LKSEKWNKSPKNLVGAKCIFEIFGLKSLKEKSRKREKNGAVNTNITSRT
jgi:hypothetical protein